MKEPCAWSPHGPTTDVMTVSDLKIILFSQSRTHSFPSLLLASEFFPVRLLSNLLIHPCHLFSRSLYLTKGVLQAFPPHCILLSSLFPDMIEKMLVRRRHLYSSPNLLGNGWPLCLWSINFLNSKMCYKLIRCFQTVLGNKEN